MSASWAEHQPQHNTITQSVLLVTQETHYTLQTPQLSCFTLLLKTRFAVAAGACWPDAGPVHLTQARWLQVDGSWNPEKPKLSTCDPLSMKFVTDQSLPQEVKEGKEIVFTYDVSFKVSLQVARTGLLTAGTALELAPWVSKGPIWWLRDAGAGTQMMHIRLSAALAAQSLRELVGCLLLDLTLFCLHSQLGTIPVPLYNGLVTCMLEPAQQQSRALPPASQGPCLLCTSKQRPASAGRAGTNSP